MKIRWRCRPTAGTGGEVVDGDGANGIEEVLFQCNTGDTAVVAGTETDLTRIESGTGSARTPCTVAPQSVIFGLTEVGSVQGGDRAQGTGNYERNQCSTSRRRWIAMMLLREIKARKVDSLLRNSDLVEHIDHTFVVNESHQD
jgi:hypothetical protein